MKYIIQKTDGTPVDPEAIYFVLRLDKDNEVGKIARNAVAYFAGNALFHDRQYALAAVDTVQYADSYLEGKRIMQDLKDKSSPEPQEKR